MAKSTEGNGLAYPETEMEPADGFEQELAKLTEGMSQVIDARDSTERTGLAVRNQVTELMAEMDHRVSEIDRAIIAEEDFIGRANRGIADLEALKAEHSENLGLLRIEKQARLNAVHEIKSNINVVT